MSEEIQNKSGGGKNEENDELTKCRKERDEYLAGWQRAKADFLNYKKDEMARLEEIARYGNEEFLKELISVLDSFDLGIAALEKQGAVEKGVYMIRAKLADVLKSRGLTKVEIKAGDKFNPEIAEAIAEIESDRPAGTILEEIEPGYKIYDKIVRPARVKISKGQIAKSK